MASNKPIVRKKYVKEALRELLAEERQQRRQRWKAVLCKAGAWLAGILGTVLAALAVAAIATWLGLKH